MTNKRSCSICKKRGHDKRKCSQKNSRRPIASVFVRTHGQAPTSQHVLRLSPVENKQLNALPSFVEKQHQPAERRVVDFAELVKRLL